MKKKFNKPGVWFTSISPFRGEPYYFNCRDCGAPLFDNRSLARTEKLRVTGFCVACRPLVSTYIRRPKIKPTFIIPPSAEPDALPEISTRKFVRRKKTTKHEKEWAGIEERINAIVARSGR